MKSNPKDLGPKLRFSDFVQSWERKTLGQMFDFKNGVNAGKSQYGSGIKFVNVLDVMSESPLDYESIIGSVTIPEKDFEKNKVEYGDVLFQRSSETREDVGIANVYLDRKTPATFGGFVIRGKKHEEVKYEPRYIWNLLKTSAARKQTIRLSGGSTRYNIGQDSLESIPVWLSTELAEQEKIASFFGSVDDKISQLEKKRDLLGQCKKGVMQQIFSQKIRFKDDNGNDFPDWEEKRLGDICSYSKGKGISKNDLAIDGETECVRYGELYTHYGEVIHVVKSKTDIAVSELVLSKAGDVLIPASGETAIDIATCTCVTREGIALGGDLNILRGDFNGPFLSYHLTSAGRIALARLAQGSSVMHLYASQFKILKICIPSARDEQRKIADFLSAIDVKINLVGQQIKQLRDFKKGLLQQMFV